MQHILQKKGRAHIYDSLAGNSYGRAIGNYKFSVSMTGFIGNKSGQTMGHVIISS